MEGIVFFGTFIDDNFQTFEITCKADQKDWIKNIRSGRQKTGDKFYEAMNSAGP